MYDRQKLIELFHKRALKFGDPRKLGAKLPLWVVIDPDGKIAHYHVGFYAIKPDEGLRPLDEAVMKQIKTK